MSDDRLYRLVYVSDNRIPAERGMRREIEQILHKARRRNAADGITGALMFNRGRFAQVLEGSEPALQRLFERIRDDPRHGNVVILQFGPVAGRAFGHWSMAYIGNDTLMATAYTDIRRDSAFDPAALSGDDVFRLLRDRLRDGGPTGDPS